MNDTTAAQLEAMLASPASTASTVVSTIPAQRANVLRAMADALDAAVDDLVTLANLETHLPLARLTGELARTTFQLRFFADSIVEGRSLDAVIRTPIPASPWGRGRTCAVSGADRPGPVPCGEQLPLRVLGGRRRHRRCARRRLPGDREGPSRPPAPVGAVGEIVAAAGAPVAVVHGVEAGTRALADPRVKAAAFTGSTAAGRALFDIAHTRSEPIPFYGELGSVNPTFLSRGAVAVHGPKIVAGFVGSFTLGVGQFCTKPGLLFLPALHELTPALVDAVRSVESAPMLGDWIESRYLESITERRRARGPADSPFREGKRTDAFVGVVGRHRPPPRFAGRGVLRPHFDRR